MADLRLTLHDQLVVNIAAALAASWCNVDDDNNNMLIAILNDHLPDANYDHPYLGPVLDELRIYLRDGRRCALTLRTRLHMFFMWRAGEAQEALKARAEGQVTQIRGAA